MDRYNFLGKHNFRIIIKVFAVYEGMRMLNVEIGTAQYDVSTLVIDYKQYSAQIET